MQEARKIPNEMLIGNEISENVKTTTWKAYLPAILAIGVCKSARNLLPMSL
jgi:hypothetical protein